MASPAPVVADDSAGYWLRHNAASIPSTRYPDGLTMRVLSARAMHDPKDKSKNIQVFELAVFNKGCSTFDSYHAKNTRWKTWAEFEQLSSNISGKLDGATAPVLASVMSARSERSPVLLEERRVSCEAFIAGIVKLWFATKNHKLKQIIARWLNDDFNVGYVQHINLLRGVDKNTSEYIDPEDAKKDKEDSMFSGISAPKLSMPSFGKLSMPKMSMPDISKLSLPSFGETPADMARKAAGAAGALEERQENQLAYIDAAFSEKDRDRHEKARQLAYVLQNGNGWTYWDDVGKVGDHLLFNRELQTVVRSLQSSGVLIDSEKKTTYYWDEPIFVSGDIIDLPLTKTQSKPGILNWACPSESDVHVIRIKLSSHGNDRTMVVEFHGKGGAEFCKAADKTSTTKTFTEGPEHA